MQDPNESNPEITKIVHPSCWFDEARKKTSSALNHAVLPYPAKLIKQRNRIDPHTLLGHYIGFITYAKKNNIFQVLTSSPINISNGIEYKKGWKYFENRMNDLKTKLKFYTQLHLLQTKKLLSGRTLYFFVGYFNHMYQQFDDYFQHSKIESFSDPQIEMYLLKMGRVISEANTDETSNLLRLLGCCGTKLDFGVYDNDEYAEGQLEGFTVAHYLHDVINFIVNRNINYFASQQLKDLPKRNFKTQHPDRVSHLRRPSYLPAIAKEHETKSTRELFDDPNELDSNFETTDEPEEKNNDQTPYEETAQTVSEPSISLPPSTLQPDWVNPLLTQRTTYSLATMSSMFSPLNPPKTHQSSKDEGMPQAKKSRTEQMP